MAEKDEEKDARIQVLYLDHTSQISGGEQSLHALLRELRRTYDDLEATIALPGSGPFADQLRDEGWSVSFAPLRRLQRPTNFFAGLATLAHVLQTAPHISKLARNLGAQIVHSNSTTAHLVGGLAAERLGIPSIWHARDMVNLARVASQLAQRATLVVAISGCVAEALQRDGVAPQKIRIVRNGIDPDKWQPHPPGAKPHTFRDALNFAPDAFVFGCVGQLVPWKNHLAFIDAAAQICADDQCGRARFVIMGGDLWSEHAGYVHSLHERVKQHNLGDRFHFVPHQTNNIEAISSLDAVVLASQEEPFGRVLLEGMVLRKIAIAYAKNGPLEIIHHEHDGLLVSPEESDGLAHAMRRVLTDDALTEHLCENARHSIVQRFHIAEGTRQIYDFYRELVA